MLSIAADLQDLRRRLGEITVGTTKDGERVTAEQIGAAGSMAVLLKDALNPNLVQTLEGQPALVHCGPFGNIASGNNSLVADRVALKLGKVVVTESGFGADMGMEKLFDIVCRAGGLVPAAAVLVATPATMALHGPANLERHLSIVRAFGIEPVVAINKRPEDSPDDAERARESALAAGATAAEICDAFERGGEGAVALARAVVAAVERPVDFHFAYEDDDSLDVKIAKLARLYGAAGVDFMAPARAKLAELERQGLGGLPVCMAKTHLSVSHDPALGATPTGFTLVVRDLRAYTGAGWVVALCGDMQTMPGLSATPAAHAIDIDADGRTVGLF